MKKFQTFLWIMAAFYLSSLALAQVPSGQIDWGPWRFDWVAGTLSEGLAIKDLTYEGEKIMEKASLPVMRVKYDNDACGPYADRLSVSSLRAAEVDHCGSDPVCQRTFTRDGKEWLELGVQSRLGEYRIYQVFYLSDDGIIDAHMFSKGLQCIVDHDHHPYWRFDIDVGDNQNDQIFTYNRGESDTGWGAGWQQRSSEFQETKNASQDRKWYVRDGVSGKGIWILPGPNDGQVDSFASIDAAGRLFRSSEDEGWRFGARGELGYGSPAEDINGQDIIFWYVAHMFHQAAEGRDIWHSAGPRLIVGDAAQGGVTPPGAGRNRAPVITHPGNQTNSLNDTVDLALTAIDSDGDAISFAAQGLPTGLSIDSTTGRITGIATNAGTFAVTVSASDGSATTSVNFDWSVINGSVLLSSSFTDDAESFGYIDDAFRGTDAAAYASGAHRPSGGFSGGGLELTVGGQDNADIFGMSGAWRSSFTLASAGETTLSLRYKLTQAAEYESDELAQILIALDGTLKGRNGSDYIAQLNGDGNGGSEQTTGWQTLELSLGNLAAGSHTLDLGIYSNKKTYNDESSQAWFDDVLILQTSVTPSNRAPSLDNPGSQNTDVGIAVSLQLSATDADGDSLNYSASGLPSGLSINSSTGLISGTASSAGSYTVTASVSDGQASSRADFAWIVSTPAPTNTPPTISAPGSQENVEGESVSLQIQASDADGDSLSYSATGLPSGLSMNSSSGVISGTLASGSAGTYTVTVNVSDGRSGSDSASFSWRVTADDTGSSVTIERRISSGNDDVEETGSGRVYRHSSDLEMISDAGLGYFNQVIGLRFVELNIPTGASIEQAYLEFTSDEVSTNPTSLRIQAEATDNAPAFSTEQNDVRRRSRTSATVNWSDIAPWNAVGETHQSPDISSVVQAVIDRPGWRSGNAIAVIISGSGTRTAESYNGSASQAPKLVITYRTDTNPPPVNTPPSLSAAANQNHSEGQTVSLQLNANDPDGDTLSYSATGLPSGLSLNSSTGLISGSLASGSVGTYTVTVSVSDGRGGSDSESFTWTVSRSSATRTVRFTFEADNEGFSLNPNGTDTATTGRWQRADPAQTSYNGYVMQLNATAEGQYALITDGRAGSSVGTYDVDAGVTSIRSPSIDLGRATSASLSLSYYLAHLNNSSVDDFFKITVIGTTTATVIDERGAANYDNASWATTNYNLNSFLGQQVYLLMEVADASTGSLVEAAVDNIVLTIDE